MGEQRPPDRSRRALLATVSLGVVAGCTSAEETPPGIGELAVTNRLAESVTVEFEFTQGDTEGTASVALPAAGEGGFEGETIMEQWMGDHGSWELVAEAGEHRRTYTSEEFDERFYDYDATDCLLMDVRVRESRIEITPRTVAVECP